MLIFNFRQSLGQKSWITISSNCTIQGTNLLPSSAKQWTKFSQTQLEPFKLEFGIKNTSYMEVMNLAIRRIRKIDNISAVNRQHQLIARRWSIKCPTKWTIYASIEKKSTCIIYLKDLPKHSWHGISTLHSVKLLCYFIKQLIHDVKKQNHIIKVLLASVTCRVNIKKALLVKKN